MANSIKKKQVKQENDIAAPFIQENDKNINTQKIIFGERTKKLIGIILILFSFFIFISISSYLFTWQDDQDKVINWSSILNSDNLHIKNLFGFLGAYFSHHIIFNGFGISSYIFVWILFIIGINTLLQQKYFNIPKNIFNCIFILLISSISFAFIFYNFTFSFGGNVGNFMYVYLHKLVGNFGLSICLIVAIFILIIINYNPRISFSFFSNIFSSKKKEIPMDENTETNNEMVTETVHNPVFEFTTNSLKSKNNGVVVIMPDEEENETTESTNKKTLEEIFNENMAKNNMPKSDIDFEIKQTETIEQPVESLHKEKQPVTIKYEPTLDLQNYKYPELELLETHGSEKIIHDPTELEAHKNQIISTLNNYDITIQKIAATVGPTVTLYEIIPSPGIRISRIKNLEDDIALSLAALGIRIIAPIPGKGTIGIEVPNIKKTVVSIKTLLNSDKFKTNNYSLPIALGKKIDNENFIVDLASMPHLLMAGATGQGKSVGLNAILVSLLYKKHPSQLKFVLVDPKKVELSLYRAIEKHFLAKLPGEEDAIITDTKKVVNTLNALCIEMDNRYDLLKAAGCRNIKEYNEKFTDRKLNPLQGHQFLPFIVLVVDEFADLIMTAGKEVEMPIARLAQLARAIGIHLIIATQRPSVNIITGTIKANFPARIAFKVSSKIDSRTILDIGGAEQLIGRGDMLVSYNGELTRVQCALVDTPEVEKVCDFIAAQQGYPEPFLLPEFIDEKELESKEFNSNDRDPLFEDAAKLIVINQIGSTSLIQRKMKLGYNRAGRIMDQLEQAGIVGPNLGSKPRDVKFTTEQELQNFLNTLT